MQTKRLAMILVLAMSVGMMAQFANAQPGDSARVANVQMNKLAIEESIAGYLVAINERNADLAASYWSETGEWIAEDGTRVRGVDNIANALAGSFESDPEGMTVSLRDLTIRMVSPNVAIEDGLAVIKVNGVEQSSATYSVVHVKTAGGWKIDTVRETKTPIAPQRQSGLDSLSWMVGSWTDQVDGMDIATDCRWTPGNRSLRRSFTISDNGEVKKSGTQVIVWDARLGQIRSWLFDSEGGFGQGIWKQQSASTWVVESVFQLADGGVGTSNNIYSRINDSTFEFQSVDRTVDGVEIESTPVINVVRTEKE